MYETAYTFFLYEMLFNLVLLSLIRTEVWYGTPRPNSYVNVPTQLW